MSAKQKLKDLGIELGNPSAPAGSYVPLVRSGDQLYISGQISSDANGVIKGRLGDGFDVAAGQKAAAASALSILAHVESTAGIALDDIKQVVKLTILVASAPDFHEQHLVANGASDLLVDVLGDAGRHARAAFGVAALPLGAAVEIDAVIEV